MGSWLLAMQGLSPKWAWHLLPPPLWGKPRAQEAKKSETYSQAHELLPDFCLKLLSQNPMCVWGGCQVFPKVHQCLPFLLAPHCLWLSSGHHFVFVPCFVAFQLQSFPAVNQHTVSICLGKDIHLTAQAMAVRVPPLPLAMSWAAQLLACSQPFGLFL